jgi:hypothetical protein
MIDRSMQIRRPGKKAGPQQNARCFSARKEIGGSNPLCRKLPTVVLPTSSFGSSTRFNNREGINNKRQGFRISIRKGMRTKRQGFEFASEMRKGEGPIP